MCVYSKLPIPPLSSSLPTTLQERIFIFSQYPLTKFSQWPMIKLMDTRFLAHNTHLEDPKHFMEHDPQLRRLKTQRYIHQPALLEILPFDVPGIYTLGGGR